MARYHDNTSKLSKVGYYHSRKLVVIATTPVQIGALTQTHSNKVGDHHGQECDGKPEDVKQGEGDKGFVCIQHSARQGVGGKTGQGHLQMQSKSKCILQTEIGHLPTVRVGGKTRQGYLQIYFT